MKRTTEQVLKDEIAVATRVVDRAVTRVERANEEWNIAAGHAQDAAGVLADASARLRRAEAALEAFTPRPSWEEPALWEAEAFVSGTGDEETAEEKA